MTLSEYYFAMMQESLANGDAQAVVEWSSKHAEALQDERADQQAQRKEGE